ncbi:N-acyl-D-amino-acid deacylase family protein [Sporolituus thermophilus]|uniref:N-acyl-D-amino-acid deacylase n=1 Tax=Sporolituus thermophilus DSM 23256 TaxID=1123285 RepID=A0A1G7NRS5_9FIRM|nr:D-aminoacylase [Sporolituus thermophilus]SDF75950.1 N-acyl-D-amino-acid deacylase [Sporolituus thermophilus DSM 23256]
MLDLKIKNGLIVDGTGQEGYYADIGIKGDKIVAMGELSGEGAREIIDATGLVVAPGFIDVHSHTDAWYFHNPYAVSKILQGVTTEIIGNCGESAAPINHELRDLLDYGKNTNEQWATTSEFIKLLNNRLGINTATLTGHGNLRALIMGTAARQASAEELKLMAQLLRQTVREGAVGFSSGLLYPPGCFAGRTELVVLCRVLAPIGGVYTTHIRDEGDGLIDAVTEAISVCKASRVRGVISHHKARKRNNWGKTAKTLTMLQEARSEGVDIYCDVYPYTALHTNLATLLPAWIHDGGKDAMLSRLRELFNSETLLADIDREAGDYETIIITKVRKPENKFFQGKSLAQVALAQNKRPAQTVITLLLAEEGSVSMIQHAIDEKDLVRVLTWPLSMVGSDAGARLSFGPLAEGLPHPRSYGTFPRVLARYVREQAVLSLPEAVRKMTSLPAAVFRLNGRGQLRPNFYADITIFDFAVVKDNANYQDPFRPPSGIEYVLVNGKPAVMQGKLTYQMSGKFLMHKPSGSVE